MTLPLGDARINCLLAYAVLAKDKRGRRPGKSSSKDIGIRSWPPNSSRWLRRTGQTRKPLFLPEAVSQGKHSIGALILLAAVLLKNSGCARIASDEIALCLSKPSNDPP